MRLTVLLLHPQSGVDALHILIGLNYFTLVCNVISVLVEMMNFAMVKDDIFCWKKLTAVELNFFDGKGVRIVVSEAEL